MPYGTINADQFTTSDGVTSSGLYGFKNRIINGAMVIDQRNAGASLTPTATGQYTLDRWFGQVSQNSKLTVQQNAGSVTPPAGFTNYLGVTSSSAYSVLTGDYFSVRQQIEGFNTADLGFGTANAATVTLSFWVRSSLTGTFGATLQSFFNGASTRTYPFTYTISSANTWEYKTVTIAGDTTGTWVGATNGVGMSVAFGLGCGSTFTSTAGSWQSGNFIQPTGTVSVVGTNGATFYITGVQLEKGSTATSFDYRPYGTEFDLCRRYCEVYSNSNCDNVPATIAQTDVNNRPEINITYYPKRSAPTITVSNNNLQFNTLANTNIAINGYPGTLVGTSLYIANMFFSTASGVTAGALSGAGCIQFTGTCLITISAEL